MTTTQTETAAPTGLALDICYGTRPATRCAIPTCNRLLPAVQTPVFELETEDGGVLCAVCADRSAHGLRLVCLLMTTVVDAYGRGDKQTAEETVRGIISALELLKESAPKVTYRRPVRNQPSRAGRRRRR